jgi:nucleoside-diphosphate-sugar epimerase
MFSEQSRMLAESRPHRALVVGSTGFLGSHLTTRLLRDGWQVYDLRFAGRTRKAALPGAQLRIAAGTGVPEIAAALPDEPFDIVFHVAAAGVQPGERDPDVLFQGNVALPQAVVRALEDRVTGRFVLAGSCAEYGPVVEGRPLREDDPTLPSDLYGASKAAGTVWTLAAGAACRVPAVALRIFHIFGPGEAPHRLVSALFQQLRQTRPVALSPGGQVRDLLFVEDVVDGLLAAASVPPGSVYNLCSSQPVSVREVAIEAARVLGQPESLLRFGDLSYRPGESMWLVGDNRRFCSASGWAPRWTLAAALKRMAAEPISLSVPENPAG